MTKKHFQALADALRSCKPVDSGCECGAENSQAYTQWEQTTTIPHRLWYSAVNTNTQGGQMKRMPSVRMLESVFPGKGQAMRNLLVSSEAVDNNPAVVAWVAKCYNLPSLSERRLCALDNVAETYGVERVNRGNGAKSPAFDYLNTGDTYAPTLVRFAHSGAYLIRSWGDIVERGNYQ